MSRLVAVVNLNFQFQFLPIIFFFKVWIVSFKATEAKGFAVNAFSESVSRRVK